MTSWQLDTFCVGAGSLLFTVGLIAFGYFQPDDWGQTAFAGEIVIANILINWPHFLASYRILYRTKANVTRHWFVSVLLPASLLALFVYALMTADQNPPEQSGLARQTVIDLLYPFGVLLLAWHYTGQSWGMTSAFAFISGVRFTNTERFLIRSGYRALLWFHVLWVLTEFDIQQILNYIYPGLDYLTLQVYEFWIIPICVTFVMGLAGFTMVYRRHGSLPPRAWIPWLATFGWYLIIWLYPAFFFVLQIAHALQYLVFPLRVEANIYAERTSSPAGKVLRYTLGYYVCLVLVGAIMFDGIRYASTSVDPHLQLSALLSVIINIHHYFTDGVIWKIRRPEVRKQLFGHIPS